MIKKWIKVEDELPPFWNEKYRGDPEFYQYSKRVLVYVPPLKQKSGEEIIEGIVTIGKYNFKTKCWDTMSSPTHWMILPDPPTEEKEPETDLPPDELLDDLPPFGSLKAERGDDDDDEPFVCPHCGSKKDPWFSRSICVREDGTEGMAYICSDCGKEVG